MLNGATTPTAPAHNISDVGMNFVTPVFALDRELIRDTANGGLGLITVFDGSKWLPPQNTMIEARVMVPTYAAASVKMFWDTNPPVISDFHNLWIPTSATTMWPAIPGGDRVHYPGYNGLVGAVVPFGINGPLRDFLIPASNPAIKDGATVQFLFVLDDGAGHLLPCAFQDPNDPSAVRPFEYALHSIIQQRGEVTITNNVINPASGQVAYLHYMMASQGAVTITVFNLNGDIVNVLARGTQAAGEYTTSWDGKNRGGRVVARGIYFIRVVGPGFDEMRKVLVVR
jgi:carbohydrate-selective porin OprB